jgi:hypothetical protein
MNPDKWSCMHEIKICLSCLVLDLKASCKDKPCDVFTTPPDIALIRRIEIYRVFQKELYNFESL